MNPSRLLNSVVQGREALQEIQRNEEQAAKKHKATQKKDKAT
jgi:hypothetical protein